MKPIPHFFVLVMAGAGLLTAQGSPDNHKLLTTFQNPVGNLISVPFQNNTNFPIGQFSRVQDVLNIQPVIPFHVTEDWIIISRWITPVVYQPNLQRGAGGANGLGDLNPSLFLSPAHPGKLIWGIGPTFLFPTATDPTLGQGKWGAGPSIVLLTQPGHWTIGFLSNNIWSIGGERHRTQVNQFLTQYFVNYNLKGGWFLTESPILTSNWMATGGKLDGDRRQSVAGALWRRRRENDESRYPACGVAGEHVLQPDPPARRSIPKVASATAGGAALSEGILRDAGYRVIFGNRIVPA
jgi:hypothetical protein